MLARPLTCDPCSFVSGFAPSRRHNGSWLLFSPVRSSFTSKPPQSKKQQSVCSAVSESKPDVDPSRPSAHMNPSLVRFCPHFLPAPVQLHASTASLSLFLSISRPLPHSSPIVAHFLSALGWTSCSLDVRVKMPPGWFLFFLSV